MCVLRVLLCRCCANLHDILAERRKKIFHSVFSVVFQQKFAVGTTDAL